MTEYFVNFTAQTTLVADITAVATSLQIVSTGASPANPQFRIRIDDELMLVTGVAGTTYTVTRGIEGTTAAAHDLGDIVRYVVTAAALGGQSDPIAATPGLRSLGTGAQQAAAGNAAPTLHASSHHSGGSDPLTGQSIAGLLTSSMPQFAGLGIGVAGASGEIRLASATLLNWNQDTYLTRHAAGTLALKNGDNPQSFHVFGNSTASRSVFLRHDGDSGGFIGISGTDLPLFLYTNGGIRWVVDGNSGSHTLRPAADNSYDLGLASGRARTGYFGTGVNIGAGDHVLTTTSVVFNEAGADVDFRIESDANASHFVSDAGAFSGVGAFGFGVAARNDTFAVFENPALTASINTPFARLLVAAGNAVTIPTGTAALVATLSLIEPNITATGTVTNAYTLYVQDAPTEGGKNGAAWFAVGDVVVGTSALATNATSGFLHIPTCAGTPTGVPANGQAGTVAMVFDTTNNKLYIYDGGWIDVT